MAQRVVKARAAAAARWPATAGASTPRSRARCCARRSGGLPAAALAELGGPLDAGLISARGYDRVLRLAWTVSDLDGRDRPTAADVHEATQLRLGDARRHV